MPRPATLTPCCPPATALRAPSSRQQCVFTYNAMHKDGIQSQGGYSSHIITDETYAFKVADSLPIEGVAPLLCAGGWRGHD